MTRDNIIFGGLCLVVIFIPLPYGGNEEWAIFVFQTATIFLFAIHIVTAKSGDRVRPSLISTARKNHGAKFKIALAVFFGISLFQLIPLPRILLRLLSPAAAKIYDQTSQVLPDVFNPSKFYPLSFSVFPSLYDLGLYVCYALFGLLVYRYVVTRKRIQSLVGTMLAGALFQAVYGLAEYFSGSERILGWKNIYSSGSAFGTFVNRNHFSGFLEMGLPLSLGWILAKIGMDAAQKDAMSRSRELGPKSRRVLTYAAFGLGPVLMGIAIFYSQSRGGILCLLATIVFMAIMIAAKNRFSQNRLLKVKAFAKLIGIVIVLISLAVGLIGVKPLAARLSKIKLERTGRIEGVVNTFSLFKDYVLFGTGLGTYAYSYKMYEKDYGDGAIVEHAHNEYLGILAESGIIGGGSLIILGLGAFIFLLRTWLKREDPFAVGIGVGCLGGIFAILVHSFVDFNLRVPANLVFFIVLYIVARHSILMPRETTAWTDQIRYEND